MIPVAVLVSGSGSNLQALIEGQGAYQVAVVVSNKAEAYGLERARLAGIPAVFLDHRRRPREDFEAELTGVLRAHGAEWVACAGFMRVLSPAFLGDWVGRVLNIHPALLPAFPGVDGQGQALAYGVRVAGCTVHFVDAGTDTGPIVAQGVVPVLPNDDHDALRDRILALEHRLYPMVLRIAVEGRLSIEGRRVVARLQQGEALALFGS